MIAGLAAVLLVVFALVVGPWLLTRSPQHGLTAEQELKAKNDVRATLVQALAGLAVAGGLIVTYRTFQHNRMEQDRTYRLRQAEQVNEFYAKGVDQLGNEQAPVRLGALYSLVHLAQTNPGQRQTVVDVLCAYLRMPYTPPARPGPAATQEMAPPATGPDSASPSGPGHDPAQELQVRQTAQRLLAAHLRCPSGTSGVEAQGIVASADEEFWPGISLDLTGATLVGLDLGQLSVVRAVFDRASFIGDAGFAAATFTGEARFVAATFTRGADFGGATFAGERVLTAVNTDGDAGFAGATFAGPALFTGASFTDDALFDGATFADRALFWGTNFAGAVRFAGATFGVEVQFGGARVPGLGASDLAAGDYRVWPAGWTVRADENDPSLGWVIPVEPADPA